MTDDRSGKLSRATTKTNAKIDAAYEKLAAKLRGRADEARAAMETTESEPKRAVQRRRFELYADAAHDIEDRLTARRERDRATGD